MLKKILTSLIIALLLSFASCGGGGSSKEAKALLQKILQFVGIPQQIVVNICQDSNRDGICGGGEIFTKVVINKGDDISDILRKISLTPDGKYFLETYNPEIPILVELQDEEKVNFDNGKFALNFNGFKTNKDNETKEISLLESMVDNNSLTKSVADKFRTLKNDYAQDKYYVMLLDTLEKNINILREKGLDNKIAVNGSIKTMGIKIENNPNQADRINNCENNQTCIDSEIKNGSDSLILTDKESMIILEENGKPTPTPIAETDNGKEVIYDGKWVKPSRSICEGNGGNYGSDCWATWENAKNICSASGDVLPDVEILGVVITDCRGDFVSYYYNNGDNWEERIDKNKANKSYQTCYKERGFTSGFYWSSTTYASNLSHAWNVNFYDGNDYWYDKGYEGLVRCVRGGK